MSPKLLNSDLHTLNDVDNQMIFFFSKFTNFLNKFKVQYKLKKIDKLIDKIHFMVKTFLKEDVLNLSLSKKLLVDYSLENELVEKQKKILNNSNNNKNSSPSLEILNILKKTKSIDDQYDKLDNNMKKNNKKLKNCLNNKK